MTEKGEPKRVLKCENGSSDSVAPGGVDTGITEKNGPENGIATGGVDPGVLYVHTTMRSMRMAWDSPPRSN